MGDLSMLASDDPRAWDIDESPAPVGYQHLNYAVRRQPCPCGGVV